MGITERIVCGTDAVATADTSALIGILGGMGPAATADFYSKLVMSTAANEDQDHPRVVIWADPTVPDRSQALLGSGEDPTPWLLRGAEKLVAAGATMIAIPCNTAHAFLQPITGRIPVPVVNMIDVAAQRVHSRFEGVSRVGLLATTGTINSRLYHHALADFGIELVTADPLAQETVVAPAIARVKAGARDGTTEELFERASTMLTQAGAELIIAGCTEVVLGISDSRLPVPLVDPAQALVDDILHRLGYALTCNGE